MRAAWDVCALGGNAAVADAVRTSLGPRGMDKLIVDSKGAREAPRGRPNATRPPRAAAAPNTQTG